MPECPATLSLIPALVRFFAALSGLFVLLAACSGGDDGGEDGSTPSTITPVGQCNTRTPVLTIANLDDPNAEQSVIDLPARSPFHVTGVRMDAESSDWVYRQSIYIAESPERASEVLRETYQQPPVANAPEFGDESSVWTEGEEEQTQGVWFRQGPTAIVLTVAPGAAQDAEAARGKVLALASATAARIADCEGWSPPVTASPVPTHTAAISILAIDNVLEPSVVEIATGATVEFTFTNQGANVHNMHIASPATGDFSESICEGLVDPCLDPSPVGPGETAYMVWPAPEEPIELPFRCDYHPREMTGTLIFE